MTFFPSKLYQTASKVFQDKPLRHFSTLGVGGLADFMVLVESEQELMNTINLCNQYSVHYKLLGNGSNIIFSDDGFRGAIIINQIRGWEILDELPDVTSFKKAPARFENLGESHYSVDALDYSDSADKSVMVRCASGTRIISLMKALYKRGITGLQWFAGIPATVGGAIYMNMHGAQFYFGDIVYSAGIFNGQQSIVVDHDWFKFDYDWSNNHKI